jgi:hypothetical protein
MNSPRDLSKGKLVALVAKLQQILFLVDDYDEESGRDVLAIDPDKEWGGDELDEIGELMSEYGLRPTEYRKINMTGSVDWEG